MIAIVDYGLGNIRAFENVYKRLGIACCLAREPQQLEQADRIILPGVGAFDHAMTALNESGMREALDRRVKEDKIPVLGICVGMQMLSDSSEEGTLPGLGWVPGQVKKFAFADSDLAARYPLPHMGWNNVQLDREDPLFAGLEAAPRFYFLHSYYFHCQQQESSLASADYGDRFSCIVRNGNVYGVQCHPEKSHGNGVSLLKNFASV